ncbi:M15 family metallopeptidase [Candidatus Sumerlaeota bacterium]|nr:M15 family metallopeptidase [Candidatus Sumerlaeota bacterium]
MRTLFAALFVFLAVGILSAAEPDPNTPWIVFTDSAPVLPSPDRDAQPVTSLSKDQLVSGILSVDKQTNDEWLAFKRGTEQLYVARTHLTRPHPANIMQGNLPYGKEIVNRWWGIPLTYEPDDLESIPQKYSGDRDDTYRLRREARDQLVKMFQAAEQAGQNIRVVSAYRSGSSQVRIYTRNIRRNPSQRSSAPPGHSEHQLGTTVDLADDQGEHVLSGSFETTPQSKWLEEHAASYGFVRTYYPDNIDETGYITEPWHWRYFGTELAAKKVAARKARLASQAKHPAG